MKLFLHIGAGRTGAKSLQRFLRRNHETLIKSGINYPVLDGKNHHNPLALPVCGSTPPRYLQARFGKDYQKNLAAFGAYFERLSNGLRGSSPEILVLSSELLGRPFSPDMGQILFNRLRRLSDDITILLYLPCPADDYLSATLQTLKTSGFLKRSLKQQTRAIIESYAPLGATIRLQEYNPSTLFNGNVCDDFINEIEPNLVGTLPVRPAERSETLSAEIMEIIQDYRNGYWVNANNQFNTETGRLLDVLIETAQRESLYRKPQLRPDLLAQLNVLDEDMVWIDQAHRFRFSTVNYNNAPVKIAPLDGQFERVRDICEFDPDLKERITMAGLAYFAAQNADPKQDTTRVARTKNTDPKPVSRASESSPLATRELDRIREISTKLRRPEMEVWAARRNFKQLHESDAVIIRRNFPPLKLDEINDWSFDPNLGVVWRLYFNSFGWAAVLGDMDSAGEVQSPDWDRAAKFVTAFLEYAERHGDDKKTDIWDDHATGYRASYLAWLFARGLAEYLPAKTTARLYKLMLLHCDVLMQLLASDKWAFSNHTLFQAEGLADLALVFLRDGNQRKRTLDVARNAVSAFMNKAITHPEGTVKEHALFYHLFLMGRLQETCRYFENIGYPVSGTDTMTFARMNEFLHDAMPIQGQLPGIGDTKHLQEFDKKYTAAFEAPELQTERVRFFRSEGKEGHAWPFLARYPTDGYYIMRSHTPPEKQLYSMLLDRPYRGPHGHWDGGSFVLFARGAPVLIDCGGPYLYANSMRYYYFTTQLAHNTVIFDNEPRQIATRCVDLYEDGEMAVVAIGAKMGKDQAWLRLFGQSSNQLAFTLDVVTAKDQDCTAEARFHVDPNCQFSIESNKGTILGDCGQIDVDFQSISLGDAAARAMRGALCNASAAAPQSQFLSPERRQTLGLDIDFDRRSFVTYKDGTMEEGHLFFVPTPMDHATLTVFGAGNDAEKVECTCDEDMLMLRLPGRSSPVSFDLKRLKFT